MVKSPEVSIIILNWNGLKDTVECLESLRKITYPNYRVIVVDNGSEGDDATFIREKFGDYVHVIENDRNYGYTGGNNIGIRYCLAHSQSDYFLILNNDTVVSPDFLSRMIEVAGKDALIGIVGPKVYYYDSPKRIQSAGARVNMWTGQSFSFGARQIDTGQYNRQKEVDCLIGCCLLINSEVIKKIGMFDESYFCYWDETDYCVRVREACYEAVYAPEATIRHKTPIKEKVWGKNPRRNRSAEFTYYYMARNNFKFMKKHASMAQYLSFILYFFGWHLWFTAAVCILYHRDIRDFIAFCRGIRDAFCSPRARLQDFPDRC